MKKSLFLIAMVTFLGSAVLGQKKGQVTEKHEYDKFKTEKSKIIPDMNRLALAQLAVHYKLTTTAKTISQEKSSGQIAGARVSAYLEFTDGDPTQADYQELTDYFYTYFQKSLKAGGIDTVGWSAITAHEFYQKVSDNDEDRGEKEEKSSNEWVTALAHNGKMLHNGMTGFAGNKGKRIVEFMKDLDAIAGFFELTLDFADVIVNLDIKSTEYKDLGNGWYRPAVTKKTYTWAINPIMTIGNPEKAAPMLTAKKGWPEMMMLWRDIESKATYADFMTEDVSKARSGLAKQFAFRKELTPVLIQTTKEKYKVAAKKALETYADTFVAMVHKVKSN